MILDPTQFSVGELRERYLTRGRKCPRQTLEMLGRDSRSGVRHIHETLVRKLQEERRESRRLTRILRTEVELQKAGCCLVAGVDEAGIGPLAGPVVAAAVIFKPGTRIGGIDDSKKLLPETRTALSDTIRNLALAVGIGLADVEEIDSLNIYHAGLLAMRRAVENLPIRPQHLLIDARRVPGVDCEQTPIIHGDALCFSIAAASIVAKVHRDALMEEVHERFPLYGFASHKGYTTPGHKKAIRELGPSPLHRKSFLYLKEVQGDCSPLFCSFLEDLYRATTLEALAELDRTWQAIKHELPEYEQKKGRERFLRRQKTLAASRKAAKRHG